MVQLTAHAGNFNLCPFNDGKEKVSNTVLQMYGSNLLCHTRRHQEKMSAQQQEEQTGGAYKGYLDWESALL